MKKKKNGRKTQSYTAPPIGARRTPTITVHSEHYPAGQDGSDGRPFDLSGGGTFHAHASWDDDGPEE